MKYHVYINYNRKVEAYERPIFRLEDPDEYVECVSRDFKASDDLAKSKIADYNLVYAGTFDDATGEFHFVERNVILNCSVLLKPVINKQDNKEVTA